MFVSCSHDVTNALATRWVISISTADGELALKRLGRTLYEAACMFYLDDARRRLAVHQERRNPAPQTSSKVAFKVGHIAGSAGATLQ